MAMRPEVPRYPRPKILVQGENRKLFVKRLDKLREVRNPQEELWREVATHINPTRYKDTLSIREARNRHKAILNNKGSLASRVTKAGLHSGASSPARPWFALTLPDQDMARSGAVKSHLYQVSQLLYQVFAMSNTYLGLQMGYGDMIDFGNAQAVIDDDYEDIIRETILSPGQYFWALDERDEIGVLYWEFKWTVHQIVKEFGYDACSLSVKNMWDNADYDRQIDLVTAVEPNETAWMGPGGERDVRSAPFVAITFERHGDHDDVLRVKPWLEWRGPVGRWDVRAGDIYGEGLGSIALPDVRGLQKLELRAGQLIDVATRPSLQMPAGGTVLGRVNEAGGIYKTDAGNGAVASPIYEPNANWLMGVENKIARHERRIEEAYFSDLFVRLITDDRSGKTAREIAEIHEEKLIQLGPTLERVHTEWLSRRIIICYNRLLRAGLLPEAPEEMRGQQLKVRYISLLAQAQQMVGLGTIERFVGFVGSMAQLNQGALDKLDADQAIDEWADVAGVPTSVVRTDEDVAAFRQQRIGQEQAAAAAQYAAAGAQTAKTLSEADTSGDNALTRMIGGPAA